MRCGGGDVQKLNIVLVFKEQHRHFSNKTNPATRGNTMEHIKNLNFQIKNFVQGRVWYPINCGPVKPLKSAKVSTTRIWELISLIVQQQTNVIINRTNSYIYDLNEARESSCEALHAPYIFHLWAGVRWGRWSESSLHLDNCRINLLLLVYGETIPANSMSAVTTVTYSSKSSLSQFYCQPSITFVCLERVLPPRYHQKENHGDYSRKWRHMVIFW